MVPHDSKSDLPLVDIYYISYFYVFIFCRTTFYRLVTSLWKATQSSFKKCLVIILASTFALLTMKWVTLHELKLTSKFCVSFSSSFFYLYLHFKNSSSQKKVSVLVPFSLFICKAISDFIRNFTKKKHTFIVRYLFYIFTSLDSS